jgi:hypothetical protein
MSQKHFNFGFLGVFVLVLLALAIIYQKSSPPDSGNKVLSVFLGAFILLFLLLGIILISLAINAARGNERTK